MQGQDFSRLILGEWVIDPIHNTLTNDGSPVKVEKRLVRVLLALAQAPQQICSKQQLLDAVWPGKVVSDDTLSVAISQLRKILGCDAKSPKFIETISGYGFRLLPAAVVVADPVVGSEDERRSLPLALAGLLVVGLLVLCVTLLMALRGPVPGVDPLLDNEAYQKARYLLQKGTLAELSQAEVLLKNLQQQQPDNVRLLNDYGKSIFYQVNYLSKVERASAYLRAKQIFEQVLALAPDFGDAHLQLALIAIGYDRQLRQAQEHFIQSIALNPAELVAHLRYAELLLALGDFTQAAQHNRIAQSLDPHYYASASIAWVYNMAGQYDDAKKELAKLYSLEPDSLVYHSSALRLYENMGDEAAAFKHYLLAFEAAGYTADELAEVRAVFAQGGLAQLNYWLAVTKNEQRDIGQYYPPMSTARYLTAAGEFEQALDYLELAYAQDDYLLLWLGSDPKYRPLYDLPRFKQLLAQLGLE